MIKAGVIGASGYAGVQAVSILSEHPNFELARIASDANFGAKLSDVYPSFLNSEAGKLEFLENDSTEFYDVDVVFLAVPHRASLEITPAFLDAGVTVIDLSADFRLSSAETYEKWYGVKHTHPELLKMRIFGLPELFPIVKSDKCASLVACAGCYVTASSLAAKPFCESCHIACSMPPVIDAISGFTGAGKNPGDKGLFVNASENVSAYGITHHRHTPEIEQILGTKVVFTPHLSPAKRGILSTVTMKIKEGVKLNRKDVHEIYEEKYENSKFVKLLPSFQFPQTTHVIGSNFAHIGVEVDEEKGVVIAICAIDNLVKGAAGQAVQCANLLFGFEEDAGLKRISLPI